MVVELNERELTVVNCCVNIEIKTLEMEKIRLEERVDLLERMNRERDKEIARLDVIDERLNELYALAKKFEGVIWNVRN